MLPVSAVPVAAEHHVHFFDADDALAGLVAGYLGEAVKAGQAAILIATADHRELFASALSAAGVDVDAAVAAGRLCLRDAADTLALFYRDGRIDVGRFYEVIGAVITDACATGRPVRIYGEMVALLWEAGDPSGAVELERLWNELGETVPFALFCAYPTRLFADPVSAERFAAVCQHHDQVIQGAPEPPGVTVTRRFPRSMASSRLARQFVADTLRGWGCDSVLDDAALIVAELAANAILHAGSDVSVGLARPDGVVRLIVGDASEVVPVPRVVDVRSSSGRGLCLVEALAQDWGHDVVAGGKLVWADLFAARSDGHSESMRSSR